jgi:hypothetical protein
MSNIRYLSKQIMLVLLQILLQICFNAKVKVQVKEKEKEKEKEWYYFQVDLWEDDLNLIWGERGRSCVVE